MEEAPATATPTATTPKAQPVIIRKNNNAPMVGAIIFLALVIGAAAIYLGMQKRTANRGCLVVDCSPCCHWRDHACPAQATVRESVLTYRDWETDRKSTV